MDRSRFLSVLFLGGFVLVAFRAAPVHGEDKKSNPVHPFTGWKDCASCHKRETEDWKRSPHGRHGTRLVEPEGGADEAVGSHWMQVFIRKDEKGYHRIQPQCFDLREKRWRSVEDVLRVIGGVRTEVAPELNQVLENRSFETDCSGCHSSQPQLRIDPHTGHMDSHWVDLAINCETCHGAGRAHAEAWRKLDTEHNLPRLEKLSAREATAICARCHGGPQTVGDFGPQDAATYVGVLDDHPGLFPDGTASGQLYQYTTFVRSPCYLEGNLTCTGCHDAHGPGLLHQEHPDALCSRCHEEMAGRHHTFHDPTSEGARCVSCHMPKVLDGLMQHQRDHRIGIPLPASPHAPDACTSCHDDETKEWADRAYRERWGAPSQATIDAVAAIHGARIKDPKAEPLLRQALEHPDPFFRASAAHYLGDATAVRDDPVPEVRLTAVRAAIRSSDHASLLHATQDETPIVRAQAALALVRLEGRPLRPSDFEDLAITARLRRNDPVLRWQLGQHRLRRGDAEGAEELFQGILAFYPHSASAWLGMESVSMKRGQQAESKAAHLRRQEGLVLLIEAEPWNPRQAAIAVKALIKAQKPERARTALETALRNAKTATEEQQVQAMLRQLDALRSPQRR